MTATIAITRPPGDEEPLSGMLHVSGYRVVHEPLTSIFLQRTSRHALHDALSREPDAVIATSRHGVAALSFLTDLRDMFLLCVGKATAKAALAAGFTRVSAGGGTAAKLAASILASYDEGSHFLYISGKHVRMDMLSALSRRGMQVERLVLYEAVASAQLSDTFMEHLKRGHLDAVTFLSRRSAEIFSVLIAGSHLQDAVNRLHAFALSETVAEALETLPWRQIHIAETATLASMAECVDNAFGI